MKRLFQVIPPPTLLDMIMIALGRQSLTHFGGSYVDSSEWLVHRNSCETVSDQCHSTHYRKEATVIKRSLIPEIWHMLIMTTL